MQYQLPQGLQCSRLLPAVSYVFEFQKRIIELYLSKSNALSTAAGATLQQAAAGCHSPLHTNLFATAAGRLGAACR
jgi:hypothetical protein